MCGTERGGALAGEAQVRFTDLYPRATRADMSVSGRERAGAFWVVTEGVPRPSNRTFWVAEKAVQNTTSLKSSNYSEIVQTPSARATTPSS